MTELVTVLSLELRTSGQSSAVEGYILFIWKNFLIIHTEIKPQNTSLEYKTKGF